MLGELEILPSDSEDWWEVLEVSKNASFSEAILSKQVISVNQESPSL